MFEQNDILPGLGVKQPKAVAGCIVALKEVFRYVYHFIANVFGRPDIC